MDRLNDRVLYLIDSSGIVYRSEDAASTWAPLILPNTCTSTIHLDSVQEGKLYCESQGFGLYISNDFGSSWTLFSNENKTGYEFNIGLISYSNGTIFVQAPSNSSRIYAAAPEMPLPTNIIGPVDIMVSSDGGKTWAHTATGYELGGLVVNPVNPDEAYLSTHVFWNLDSNGKLANPTLNGIVKTSDGGKSWSRVSYPALQPTFDNGDYSGGALLWSKDYSSLLAVIAEHVWQVPLDGSAWTQSDQGLTGNYGLHVVVDPATPTTIYLAASNGHGISKSMDGGKTWKTVFNVVSNAVAVDPFNSKHVLAGVSLVNPLSSTTNSSLQVSNDGGVTWTDGPRSTGLQSEVTCIVFDPTTSGIMYTAAYALGGIAKSTDGGASWTSTTNGLDKSGSKGVFWLDIDPENSQVLLAGTYAGVYKSSDGGSSWVLKDATQTVYSIAYDANHSGYAYQTGSSGLLKSTDHGETWTTVDLGRSDLGLLTLAIDPKSADTLLLIGSSGTVGWSPDGGTTWTWLPDGLPNVMLGGNFTHPAIAKGNPEVLYIPSPTVGLVSLTLQH